MRTVLAVKSIHGRYWDSPIGDRGPSWLWYDERRSERPRNWPAEPEQQLVRLLLSDPQHIDQRYLATF